MPLFRIVWFIFPNFILTDKHYFFKNQKLGGRGFFQVYILQKRPMTEKKHIVSLVLKQRIPLYL